MSAGFCFSLKRVNLLRNGLKMVKTKELCLKNHQHCCMVFMCLLSWFNCHGLWDEQNQGLPQKLLYSLLLTEHLLTFAVWFGALTLGTLLKHFDRCCTSLHVGSGVFFLPESNDAAKSCHVDQSNLYPVALATHCMPSIREAATAICS